MIPKSNPRLIFVSIETSFLGSRNIPNKNKG
jgi:hypothetical protein